MSKTNKELAVELYSEFMRSSSTIFSNPNFKGTIKMPDLQEMADNVEKLTKLLSAIEDK
ncbi:hypothetical protein WJ0W_004721 [Paenibacillus melissococcoides]|uniref:Uncharacterized protein n=1 Tax=Paenibacillus melissococcoides TaxID=2912268 RepID=A0ABN8U856_9BACL|nr:MULTISPECIES: hypothetical protein [Paenibacillus]QVQ56231.1 hypothetical protein [Paenibacillus phage Pd_22F]CAH8243604.1 hypothetical protein WJ0W_000843 [Paenibacillus melissococcoides]CAH8247339.1 hypothetical protein WJ0W_004573 [Paenibacillus melissococcoides]CAH8247486.1 hypothetical protein WJ0W_004721 [Paenibacillus melissococcoides]CAH8704998.1 hypothetical protein WDD9_000828 [Paenibacillus melissococcoides]